MKDNNEILTNQQDDPVQIIPVVDVYDALKNIMKGYGGTSITYNDVDPSISITSIVVPNPSELKYQIGQVLNASFGIKITPNPRDATKVDIAIDPTATQLGYQIMNPTLIGGSNISLTKDANAGTIRIDALNSQANAPTQQQIYALNKQVIQSGNVKVTPNDANNTMRLDYALDQAFLYQPLKPTLVAGTNVTLTPNEANQTITVAASSGTTFTPTQANIYPATKPTLVAGTNVTIVPNDTNNTLTITASAGSAGEDDVLRAKAVNASSGQTTLVALTEPLITKTLADSTYAPSSTLGDQIYAGISNDVRAGSNVSIIPNPTNKTITISSTTSVDPTKEFTSGTANTTTINRALISPDGATGKILFVIENGTSGTQIQLFQNEVGALSILPTSINLVDSSSGNTSSKSWSDILTSWKDITSTYQTRSWTNNDYGKMVKIEVDGTAAGTNHLVVAPLADGGDSTGFAIVSNVIRGYDRAGIASWKSNIDPTKVQIIWLTKSNGTAWEAPIAEEVNITKFSIYE